MKKFTLFILLSLICYGCSTKEEPKVQRMYTDGTYVETANGYGGEFFVETVIQDDKIKDIVVKEHNETPSIGGVAIEQMIQKMKSENRYDIDMISGATKTSQALKEAVAHSLEKAKNSVE